MYVWVCMYRYICIFLRSGFSSLSFLFCVPYSCLPTVSLEVDVQTLKPPSARPRTAKYVRVGYNYNLKKKKKYNKSAERKYVAFCGYVKLSLMFVISSISESDIVKPN